MSDNDPQVRSGGPEGGRPDGEAPRTRFGAGAQGGGGGGRGPGGGGRDGGPGGGRGPRRGGGGGRFGGRRKVCGFCVDNIGEVDYKDISRLRRYISERGKIEPRRKLGTCARHQRSLTTAIKRARHVALLPFTTASR
jgi:small subunit ribosomal protein S18